MEPNWSLILGVFLLISLLVGVVQMIGAVQMLRLRSYGWAMTATVLALLPCQPFWPLSLIMGVWGLIVLNRPAVKAAFAAASGAPTTAAPRSSRQLIILLTLLCLLILSPLLLAPLGWLLMPTGKGVKQNYQLPPYDPAPATTPIGQAQKWTMTSEGPEISVTFANSLGLQPQQRQDVNKALQAAFHDYLVLEDRYAREERTDDGHWHTTIEAFSADFELFEGQLWTRLDAVLDPQQQSRARLNLPIRPRPNAGPMSIAEIVAPGMFGWAGSRCKIEVWRVGQWFHWMIYTRGHAHRDQAPQLPTELARFWKYEDEQRATPPDPTSVYQESTTYRRPTGASNEGALPPLVAYSGDGEALLAVIGDGIHSWNAKSGLALGRKPLAKFSRDARSGMISPDGSSLTVVRPTGTVELWDLNTGKRSAQLNAAAARVAQFAPNQKTAAVANADNELQLWNVAADSLISSQKGDQAISALAYSADGSLLAVGRADGTVELRVAKDGEHLTTLKGLPAAAVAMAFTFNGARLAAGTRDGVVYEWLVQTGDRQAVIKNRAGLTGLAYAGKLGESLAAVTLAGEVTEWGQAAPKQPHTPPSPSSPRVHLVRVGQIVGREFVVDSNLAVGTGDGKTRVFDLAEPASPRELGSIDAQGTIHAVAGRYAYAADEQRLHIYDIQDPAAPREVGSCLVEQLWDLTVHNGYAYVTDGRGLGVISLADPTMPKEVGRCEDLESTQGLAVAGKYAYVGTDFDGLRVVDISDPTAPKEVGAFEGPGNTMDVAVQGNFAYVADFTGGIWVLDISDPRGLRKLGRYGDWIIGQVAVHDKYLYMAGGSLDVVDVSDPADPKPVGSFESAGDTIQIVGERIYVTANEPAALSILRAVWVEP